MAELSSRDHTAIAAMHLIGSGQSELHAGIHHRGGSVARAYLTGVRPGRYLYD